MKLLVSPINREEAIIASRGGADIVDVKNPKEGSLGANFPWIIRDIKEAVDGRQPISATIGDFNYKPGTASLAAFGAAVAGADYIKVGLYDIQTEAPGPRASHKNNTSCKGLRLDKESRCLRIFGLQTYQFNFSVIASRNCRRGWGRCSDG